MILSRSIRRLRITAFLLFLIPTIGLLGSIFFHNYLVTFNYDKDLKINFKSDMPGEKISILCNESNEYCDSRSDLFNFKFQENLNECFKYHVVSYFIDENSKLIEIESTKDIKNIGSKVYREYLLTETLSDQCILNSDLLVYYKFFPFFFEASHKLKKHEKTQFGTGFTINPFFKGETSISNIVKRFPFNFFFKPLLFITVVCMIFYWYYFNSIIKKLTNESKNYYFFKFGILSALFLFLHIFFLGWTFESEFLTKLRRTYVVFFILFEILAQSFLIKKLWLMKNNYAEYLNTLVVYAKLIFVVFVCSSTMIILAILMFYNLSPKIDYILEWNYFLILLIFYFLSYIMWKKLNVYPSST